MYQKEQINVHRKSLEEGKELISKAVMMAYCKREGQIVIIHGYHVGTAHREYLDSSKFISDMKKLGISVVHVKRKSNPGDTLIIIALSPKRGLKKELMFGDLIKRKGNWQYF